MFTQEKKYQPLEDLESGLSNKEVDKKYTLSTKSRDLLIKRFREKRNLHFNNTYVCLLGLASCRIGILSLTFPSLQILLFNFWSAVSANPYQRNIITITPMTRCWFSMSDCTNYHVTLNKQLTVAISQERICWGQQCLKK